MLLTCFASARRRRSVDLLLGAGFLVLPAVRRLDTPTVSFTCIYPLFAAATYGHPSRAIRSLGVQALYIPIPINLPSSHANLSPLTSDLSCSINL